MQKANDISDATNATSSKKSLSRCRSFHFRYLELCRSKNMAPVSEIRAKGNTATILEFFGDKIGVSEWLLLTEALFYDQVLQTLGVKLRRCMSNVLDHIDTEKKAKLYKQKPVIFTKFVFSGVVEAISNCVEFNKNLKVLNLEALPLSEKYCEAIAKALSSNECLKEISFQRSPILDQGCEVICNTIKYLDNIEKLNMSDCGLTTKGAESIAEMIKMQKISRYTEGWQKSLRYREFDPDEIPGLRSIVMARNPQIGDDGAKAIVEVLKEDVWVKIIDMENCGLTDRSANMILDCLEINQYLVDFNIRNNAGISKFLVRNVREQLGKDEDDQRTNDDVLQQANGMRGSHPDKKVKVTISQLMEQIKTLQEQLNLERTLRKKAEQLNEKLNQQIIAYENRMEKDMNADIPEGYVVVKDESLQSLIRERNDFEKIVNSASEERDFTCDNRSVRSKQLNLNLQQHMFDNASVELSPPVSSRSNTTATYSPKSIRADVRMAMKVRKVKSEMKYVEEPTREQKMKKESKSDHEFPSETEAPIFERDIGDTLSNKLTAENTIMMQMQMHSQQSQKQRPSAQKERQQYNNNSNNYIGDNCNNMTSANVSCKYDIDNDSIATNRSLCSETDSVESRTIRNIDYDSASLLKFGAGGVRYSTRLADERSARQQAANAAAATVGLQQSEYGQGEGADVVATKSPRSVFLG